MRHLGSLALSLVLGPVIWVLLGYGLSAFNDNLAPREAFFASATGMTGVAALVAAGVLAAVLVLSRLSPVGPALVGLAYAAATVWWALDPATFDRLDEQLSWARDVQTPARGLLVPLAVMCLATLFSRRRWQGSAASAGYPGAAYVPPWLESARAAQPSD